MAQYFDSSGVNYQLNEIIKGATQQIILVSPYLQINDRIRQMLEVQDRATRDIRVIYGKSELQPAETAWLRGTSIRTYFCKNLHAKCYLSESHALITSMNLYEYSQVNNEEMGILVSREHDTELYDQIYADVDRLMQSSEPVRLDVEILEKPTKPKTTSKPKSKPAAKKSPTKKTAVVKAHCIRCSKSIPYSMDRPLCEPHYKSWARYENEEYPEEYCHSCGKERETTYAKPLCIDCFRKQASSDGPQKRSVPPWFRKKK